MTRRGWNLPEREAPPEHAFLNRRKFMKSAGLIGAGLVAGCGEERVFKPFDEGEEGPGAQSPPIDTSTLYPASANLDFAALDRPLTREDIAATYNNFYEFTVTKKCPNLSRSSSPCPGRSRFLGSWSSRRPTTSMNSSAL